MFDITGRWHLRTSFIDFVIIEKPQPKASVNICDIITQCIQKGIYQTFNAARSVKCGAAFQIVPQSYTVGAQRMN